jgi:hypothetical protein
MIQEISSSYFFSIAYPLSISRISQNYIGIKHIENTLEEIHNYLPHPRFFFEVVGMYIDSNSTSEYIVEKLKVIEEIVLFTLSYFSEETVVIKKHPNQRH